MRTYPLHEARAEFSKLVDRALAGEPQRVTRCGREAVMIVSEAEWSKRPKSAATLADLLLAHAGDEGYDDLLGNGEDSTIHSASTSPQAGCHLSNKGSVGHTSARKTEL